MSGNVKDAALLDLRLSSFNRLHRSSRVAPPSRSEEPVPLRPLGAGSTRSPAEPLRNAGARGSGPRTSIAGAMTGVVCE